MFSPSTRGNGGRTLWSHITLTKNVMAKVDTVKVVVPGEGSSPPSVSGSIQLSTLPAGPEIVIPAVWACSGGESPFHQIPRERHRQTNHPAPGAVSFLRPCLGSHQTATAVHLSHGGGNFLSWACALPSAALPLLAITTMIEAVYNHNRLGQKLKGGSRSAPCSMSLKNSTVSGWVMYHKMAVLIAKPITDETILGKLIVPFK